MKQTVTSRSLVTFRHDATLPFLATLRQPVHRAQSGARVSFMTVRATGAGGKYTFGSDEGRNLRLGAADLWLVQFPA